MSDWPRNLAGKFIVLDGPDGCGKTTQLARLADHLEAQGSQVERVRDPGGTPIGEAVRSILLHCDNRGMDVRCEMLLFMASRAQLVQERIRPALLAGRIVLADRFISATCAYQGAGGLDFESIMAVGRAAVGDCWPHLTIILDVDPTTGAARLGQRQAGRPDAMERRSEVFHARVREIFLELPAVYPRPVEVLDGSGSEDSVHRQIVKVIRRVLV